MIAKIEENLSTLWPIFLFAIVWLGFAYITYMVWFKPSEYQDRMIKAYERLPKWYPFRDVYISTYRSPSLIWLARVVTILIWTLAIATILFTIWGLIYMP